jgi:threonine dehydratase
MGAFKIRGGISYIESLKTAGGLPRGLVTATRGNHGQSVAFAAQHAGVPALIVIPEGNSPKKNAAMEAFGGELIVAGKDFDEARGFDNRPGGEARLSLRSL